jgi:hypothetical protein
MAKRKSKESSGEASGSTGAFTPASSREGQIEDRIIRNIAALGYAHAAFIRRCRVGRYVGIVDLLLLPASGPRKVVLIEVKAGANAEGHAKVVGQLLLYLTGVLRIGSRGIELMRTFAQSHLDTAMREGMTSLKMLSGGVTPPDAAWAELQKGRPITRSQVHLLIGLDVEPSAQLREILSLIRESGLEIDVVTAPDAGPLRVWPSAAAS